MPPPPESAAGPEGAREGARARLGALYQAHADFVVRISRQLGAPAAQLEDVVHDVFLVVHRRIDEYDASRGSPRAWLYGIARNVVLHRLRGQARAERRLRLLPDPEPRPGPDERLARNHAASLVQRFLDELDEDRRMVFALIEIEGMSAPEVAEALGVKLNTVYSRLRLARQQFKATVDRLQRGRGGPHGGA
ncbi:RNA polymerase sigma factor [Nannocystis punicea]|uniref:Sigma-70 family RNA polymerase sigma factor n=1 Tax=Nannocystis punicea TaxID=2995304 RepID=A0ABY7H8F5_9BACT|nr:sigma-70 family RNA polymerase sigma factor [Nannocystis poenicansa]WAS95546.1 sigma-70 family RNA polymerase sigma factor [Nannocystis poenicansa]